MKKSLFVYIGTIPLCLIALCFGSSVAGQGFQTCGLRCPNDYHVSRVLCTPECGGPPCNNAVFCDRNTGNVFTTCGLSCPNGYHVSQVKCISACGPPGDCNNAAVCVKN